MLLRVDTENGKASEGRRLLVTRNNTYALALTGEGAEIDRVMHDGSRGNGALTGDAVLAFMLRVLEGSQTGRTGFELAAHLARSKDPHIRREAVGFLGDVEERKAEAAELLIPRLEEPAASYGAAMTAVRSLGRLGPPAAKAIGPLSVIARTKNGDQGVRQQALVALGAIDPKGAQVLPVLVDGLRSRSPYVRIGAALAFKDLDASVGPRAVPPLLSALKSTTTRPAQRYLVQALQRYAAHAGDALPRLRELAANEDVPKTEQGRVLWDVEQAAREAIAAIEAARKPKGD